MLVDVLQPFITIQKLIHPRASWQPCVCKTKGTVSGCGKNSVMHRNRWETSPRCSDVLGSGRSRLRSRKPIHCRGSTARQSHGHYCISFYSMCIYVSSRKNGSDCQGRTWGRHSSNSICPVPSRASTPLRIGFVIAPSCRGGRRYPCRSVVRQLGKD